VRPRPKLSEQQLAAGVVSWLESRGWDVYQEVEGAGGRADIVALLGRLCWVIECKLLLGWDVCEQALYHRPGAHMISVATPARRRSMFAHKILETLGIGHIEVESAWMGYGDKDRNLFNVAERIRPQLHRHLVESRDMRTKVHPEHKTHAAAGSNIGGQVTAFKLTAYAVRDYVKEHPGATFKEVLDQVETHYASKGSARAHLSYWIERGKVKGLRLERTGRKMKLFPAEDGEEDTHEPAP
jgi:hypothetical protein